MFKILGVCGLMVLAGLARSAEAVPETPPAEPVALERFLARLPAGVDLEVLGEDQVAGVPRLRLRLQSLQWSAGVPGLKVPLAVSPRQWSHALDLYLPDAISQQRRALLVINNGIRHPAAAEAESVLASDFTPEMLAELARRTGLPVVSLSDVPNQFLRFEGLEAPLQEDYAVARSWRMFLDDPRGAADAPLQMAMTGAVVKAMDAVGQQLGIDSFILTGMSKRGWAAWLTALVDERVEAIAPMVIDILNAAEVLAHTQKAYAGHWPGAMHPYWQAKIPLALETENFARLLQIIDPLQYPEQPYRQRLAMPKLLFGASGDDFFLPDNQQFYLDALPGPASVRSAPNTDHYGIREHAVDALVPFMLRLIRRQALPVIEDRWPLDAADWAVRLSEQPIEVTRWTTTNSVARDFRKACGVVYEAHALKPARHYALQLAAPEEGWTASFLEARFADGYTATTPVRVVPNDQYTTLSPPTLSSRCSVLD